ncbi:peptidoglycan editing factor PgeF [Luteimonas sp. 50]|uniref:Purine nucleoside phosphorylase n=1 Tax=Cognatiluteimonas sedimenti TaxID=2927791 RepID=A0ABT0A4B1_9GAMM|nr:peptidoglycan editing factor PgeF [Lysobacter sedimenti]MCJ0825773.1 peptidoglycan editing factor PgeF [Lysobacter sedimenti]
MSAILAADWPAPPGVAAFTTLRHGAGVSAAPFDRFNLGTRCGDVAEDVAGNRAELLQRFGLPSPPRWLRQVHGTTVAIEPGTDEPEADAAVTRMPGTVLAILTADCLPVVLASDDGGEVAVAHAGWRGLHAGVLESTAAAMEAAAGRIVAWLGPAAGPRAYEVGDEVFSAFVDRDPRAAGAFAATRPGHWRADLYALARQRLADAGVTRVHGGGLCTISDPQRFFSHRRDQRGGRMATLAWQRPA